MTLWWIGNAVLLVVLVVVIVLLTRVLSAARSIVPSVQPDRGARRPPARRTSTPSRSC